MVVAEAMMKKKFGNLKTHLMSGKKKNITEIKNRLNGWQLESFEESYDYKIKNGISLFKKNLKDEKI